MRVIAIIVAIGCLIGLVGCASIKVDGKIDNTEAAYIRIAVGVAFTARPDLVAPAYTVSSSLLEGQFLIADLDAAIRAKAAEKGLQPGDTALLIDLKTAIAAEVAAKISIPAGSESAVIGQVIQIVNETAKARL